MRPVGVPRILPLYLTTGIPRSAKGAFSGTLTGLSARSATPERSMVLTPVLRMAGSARSLRFRRFFLLRHSAIWCALAMGAARVIAQPVVDCARFDAPISDLFYAIAATAENELVAVGMAVVDSGLNEDLLVVRMGADGSLGWSKTLGGAGRDAGQGVAVRPDGSIIIAGYTSSTGSEEFDYGFWLLALDQDGDVLWSTVLQTPAMDGAFDVVVLSGGSALATGRLDGRLASVRVDAQGQIMDARAATNMFSYGQAIVTLSDGGFAVAGVAISEGTDADQLVIRFDAQGEPVWQSTLTGLVADQATDIQEAPDLGVVVCGAAAADDIQQLDQTLARFDSSGNVLWANMYGTDSMEFAEAVVRTPDGTWRTAGFSTEVGRSTLLQVDHGYDGVVNWARALSMHDTLLECRDLVLAPDGGLWGVGSIWPNDQPSGLLSSSDPLSPPCAGCGTWYSKDLPAVSLSFSPVELFFGPSGNVVPFVPAVTGTVTCQSNCVVPDGIASPEDARPWYFDALSGQLIHPGGVPGGPATGLHWRTFDATGRLLGTGHVPPGASHRVHPSGVPGFFLLVVEQDMAPMRIWRVAVP